MKNQLIQFGKVVLELWYLSGILMLGAIPVAFADKSWAPTAFALAIAAFYLAFLATVLYKVEFSKSAKRNAHEELNAVLLYAISWILLAGLFAVGWHEFEAFTQNSTGPDGSLIFYRSTFSDAFYFSTILLSTVGFGDFIPRYGFGRTLATEQVIIGHVHSVAFFALLIMRISARLIPAEVAKEEQ